MENQEMHEANVHFNQEDIELVKVYNGTNRILFFDPLYVELLEQFLQLTHQTSWDTVVISDATYIETILRENRASKQAKRINMANNPITTIQKAVEHIYDSVPAYRCMPSTKENT